jgi:peptidoglycan/LPS O-acetylase OafA/YrhL
MSAAFTGSRQDAAAAQGRFHAVLTCGVVLVALLALDDITTDSSTTFALERAAVIACGVWFAFIARQLWRQGRRGLAVVSAALLGLAAVAQPGIRPGVSSGQFGLVVTWIALVWFLIVAGVMGSHRIRRKP